MTYAGPGKAGAARAARSAATPGVRLLYLVDIGLSTTVATVVARLLRRNVVVDTGDAVGHLARSVGGRSRRSLLAAVWGEKLVLSCAAHVVVRGSEHLKLVPQPATLIRDLAPASARPVSPGRLREALQLSDAFVVGLVGSLNWSPRLGVTYGWDLLEALPFTAPNVAALIVGDGDGLAWLRARAADLGVLERCHFVGRVPFDDVHEWVSVMDAALSTQSNDVVGAVRTTGKLPLYLACGCPVLASRVGEARILLGDLGWTVPYSGVVDREYPRRLAHAISTWAADPSGQTHRRQSALALSAAHFSHRVARKRVGHIVHQLVEAVK